MEEIILMTFDETQDIILLDIRHDDVNQEGQQNRCRHASFNIWSEFIRVSSRYVPYGSGSMNIIAPRILSSCSYHLMLHIARFG